MQRVACMPAQIIMAMDKKNWREDPLLQLELVTCLHDEGCANFAEYSAKQGARGTYGSAAELRVAQGELNQAFDVYEERVMVPLCPSCSPIVVLSLGRSCSLHDSCP